MIPKVLGAIICASCMLFACTRVPSLQEKLLSLGGQSVEQQDEPDADRILSRGSAESGKGARFVLGYDNNCHQNSAALWLEDPERRQLVTGWALTKDDGIWRQHSWVKERGRIIETTAERDLYFGFVLTPEEAKTFAAENKASQLSEGFKEYRDGESFLADFRKVAKKRRFYVKFPFTDGKVVEHMWVAVEQADEKHITGTLDNDPYKVTSFQRGQKIERELKESEQWISR